MVNTEKLRKVTNTNKYYISDLMAEKAFASKYNRQSIDFLIETETTCNIEKIGQSVPKWNKNGKLVNTYKVTLKNKKHNYTFDFYDSIKNTEENKILRHDFYSVLACLDSYVTDNFDEFCSDFGYEFKNESEYINAKSTHLACIEQAKNLNKLFTNEQLEKLSEIR